MSRFIELIDVIIELFVASVPITVQNTTENVHMCVSCRRGMFELAQAIVHQIPILARDRLGGCLSDARWLPAPLKLSRIPRSGPRTREAVTQAAFFLPGCTSRC